MDPQLSPRLDKLIIAAEQTQAGNVAAKTPMSAEEFLRNKDNVAGIPSTGACARMTSASSALLHAASSAWPSHSSSIWLAILYAPMEHAVPIASCA